MLVNTGIRDIFYEKPYKLDTVADILKHTGVKLHAVSMP